jgi:hypothetical protein
MTASKRVLLTGALGLAIPLAACSNSVTLTSARMCSATGGTYTANVCSQGSGEQATAVQMCQGDGGVYDSVLDMCEIPGSSK